MNSIKLQHSPLFPVSPSAFSLHTPFLDYTLRLPLLISCMTGGTAQGRQLNKLLARSAQSLGIGIGTGSIRVMLDHPETREHFMLKKAAPDVPVLANIGAAQLVQSSRDRIIEAVRSIEADGVYIHLNPAQEIFQTDGDDDFTGWYGNIAGFIAACKLPVLIKETGAGIPPAAGLRLLDAGAAFIDLAGSGGTDWVAVEAHRLSGADQIAAESFRNWGYPTGELLLAYRQISRTQGETGRRVEGRIIASGGLRTPRDFAVSLAAGAQLTASALPFLTKAAEEGSEGVAEYVSAIELGIRAAMSLSGCSSLQDFRNSHLRVPESMAVRAEQLAEEALSGKEASQ